MRLVTNSFAPLARIFGKSEYSLYRLSLSRQLSATLSATACKYLAAVGRGHTLTEAVLLGALELLGLVGARSSHFVLPPEKILPAAPPWGGAALTRRRAEKTPRGPQLIKIVPY